MAKPPVTGPHSDIDGVNRDARAGSPSTDPSDGKDTDANPTNAGKGRPDEGQAAQRPKD